MIIMNPQESDTAVKAEAKAHKENYHLGTERGDMTQTRTGKGIGKEIGAITWKVKDGTEITEKRVEAKSGMIMTETEAETGIGGDG